jgi:hypothetical protein
MILGFSLKLNPGLSPNRSCKIQKKQQQQHGEQLQMRSLGVLAEAEPWLVAKQVLQADGNTRYTR